MADCERIGIIGVSGFIGRHLARLAASRGHTVIGYSRKAQSIPGCHQMRLVRDDGPLSTEGLDVVVNLAGESVLGLWTEKKKHRILQSRIGPTRRIVDAIAAERASCGLPKVLINASAIGFYGATGDRIVNEGSPRGSGFLAETCGLWESEALRARDCGARVALMRIGFVLGSDGGAMPLLKPVFRCGLGGQLGNGRQYMSWIHVEDVARIILYAVDNEKIEGPLNVVAPEAVTNRMFTKSVARAARRPAFLPAPAFFLRFIFGSMSELLLASMRVESRELQGFSYEYAQLDSAMAEVFLSRKN